MQYYCSQKFAQLDKEFIFGQVLTSAKLIGDHLNVAHTMIIDHHHKTNAATVTGDQMA